MNDAQFSALAQLMRRNPATPTSAAVRDVFVGGLTARQAAEKHGLNYMGVSDSCRAFRRGIRLCYTAVTGELPPGSADDAR